MNTTTLANVQPPKRAGAQPGNRNAVKPKKDSAVALLAVRCKGGDKGNWVRAARKAMKNHELDGLMAKGDKSMLTAWVCKTLNAAAERALGT